jgi:hypothetical protein
MASQSFGEGSAIFPEWISAARVALIITQTKAKYLDVPGPGLRQSMEDIQPPHESPTERSHPDFLRLPELPSAGSKVNECFPEPAHYPWILRACKK